MKKIVSTLFVLLYVTNVYCDLRRVPRFLITDEQINLNRCYTLVNDFDQAIVF